MNGFGSGGFFRRWIFWDDRSRLDLHQRSRCRRIGDPIGRRNAGVNVLLILLYLMLLMLDLLLLQLLVVENLMRNDGRLSNYRWRQETPT